MTKKIDKSDTRRKILAAAMSEFADKGFSGTRMSSIAAKAVVNQALIHYHFGNKEQLYRSIFLTFLKDDAKTYTESIKRMLSAWETGPETELCAMLYLIISAYMRINTKDFNKLMAREVAERSEFIRGMIAENMLPKLTQIEDIIQRGIDQGCFETADPLLFALSILVFIDSYHQAEDIIEGTEWHDSIYKDKETFLFKFICEYAFKTLRPEGRPLYMPELNSEQVKTIDSFIAEIKEDTLL